MIIHVFFVAFYFTTANVDVFDILGIHLGFSVNPGFWSICYTQAAEEADPTTPVNLEKSAAQ